MPDVPSPPPGPSSPVESPGFVAGVLGALDSAVWCAEAEPPHRVLFVSAAVERIVGRAPAEFRADPGAWPALVHPEDRPQSDRIYETLRREGSACGTYRVLRPDGTVRWVEDRAWLAADVLPSGSCFVGIVDDVTARRLAGEEVRRSGASLRALLNATHASIYLVDENRRLAAVNETGARSLGSSPAELVGRSAAECMPAEVAARRVAWVDGLFEGDGRGELEDDLNGRVYHARAYGIRDESGAVRHVAIYAEDVTEARRTEEALRRSEERFRHQALHDALTGLANRRSFLEQAARAVDRARRRRHALAALLYLDLDRFKPVNDRLGHERGDELLAGVARRLEASVRPGDVVGRLGGDEFGILLDDVKGAGEAIRVAERVQRAVDEPFDLGGHEAQVSASIGIAFTTSGGTAEELFREADMALYRAKRRGPGRTELYDAAMQAAAALQMELEADLSTALERDEMLLLLQPVVSLGDRAVRGAESLLRWRHPRRGLLAPADFLELAEETGAIVPIGRWALRLACRAAAGWPAVRGRPVRLLVNVSARELREERFAGDVFDALAAASLPAERLELEVSEATLAQETWGTPERLADLVRDGVRLSLDDFGRTSLALERLRRVPFRVLKLDRDLVRRSPGDGGISRAAVALAHTLGLTVVAEGVETPEEMEAVREAGCDEAQGNLVSPPLPLEELPGFLSGP